LPANVNLKVLEETADTKYLILPREGAGKLSEEDLKHIASGILHLALLTSKNLIKAAGQVLRQLFQIHN
jgi:hypothetical protein